MLACRIHAKDDLRVEPQAMPAVGENEVLLRLGAGGICGSDLHYYFEGRNGSFVVREPLIPGHEASAVVAAVGSAVTRLEDHRPPAPVTGKRYPACRLVLSNAAAIDLMNKMQQITAGLVKAGVLKQDQPVAS